MFSPKPQLKAAQVSDPALKEVASWVSKGVKPNIRRVANQVSKAWLRDWSKLYIDPDGIMRRMYREPGGREYQQIVLPASLKSIVYKELHG